MFRTFAVAGLLAALPLAPLAAQRTGVTAEEAMSNARDSYGPPPPVQNCAKPKGEQSDSEIVVCAEQQKDYSQFRVKSTSELDPNSPEALKDGVPRAPDVAGDGIFKGKGISLGGKINPAYMIDFKLLPDAPEGSDADLIGKGERKGD